VNKINSTGANVKFIQGYPIKWSSFLSGLSNVEKMKQQTFHL